MAQSASGDSVTVAKKEVNAQPWIVRTADATLKAWLDNLVIASGDATDRLATADTQALWAARIVDTDTNIPAGSSYVVSAEAQKRIQAGRY